MGRRRAGGGGRRVGARRVSWCAPRGPWPPAPCGSGPALLAAWRARSGLQAAGWGCSAAGWAAVHAAAPWCARPSRPSPTQQPPPSAGGPPGRQARPHPSSTGPGGGRPPASLGRTLGPRPRTAPDSRARCSRGPCWAGWPACLLPDSQGPGGTPPGRAWEARAQGDPRGNWPQGRCGAQTGGRPPEICAGPARSRRLVPPRAPPTSLSRGRRGSAWGEGARAPTALQPAACWQGPPDNAPRAAT
jgi:hypothetical protein